MTAAPRRAAAGERWRASVLALLLVGCAESGPPAPAVGPGVRSEVSRGPIAYTVAADPETITVGEKVRLSVEVTAPDGVTITMPEIGETLGSFTVRSRETPPDVPREGGDRRWRHRFVLDTFDPGPAEVPALAASFVDAREEPAIEGTLESEPLVLTVRSVLAADATESDFRDIRGAAAVPLPFDPRRWWPLAVALGAVVLAMLALVARRRRQARPAPVVPPHVWARAALERLAVDDPLARGDHQAFYFRLSGIVREYIERRFGLMAPERTTEEFLREARRSPRLREDHKTQLAGFLRAADLVKFARHRPSREEADAAFAGAISFVDQTTPREGVAAQPDEAPAEVMA